MKKYYNKETNTYIFNDDVEFTFNLDVNANINACDIKAFDINARNISYHAVCFAYNNIKCKSIEGERNNSRHFVLDGVLEIEEENV